MSTTELIWFIKFLKINILRLLLIGLLAAFFLHMHTLYIVNCPNLVKIYTKHDINRRSEKLNEWTENDRNDRNKKRD